MTCLNAHMRQRAYAGGMNDAVELLHVLADPTRLAALTLLRDGQEHCVCELMLRLGASQSRMSRHMATLRQAGFVMDRRDAQWVRYRLNPALSPEVRRLLDAALALRVTPVRSAA